MSKCGTIIVFPLVLAAILMAAVPAVAQNTRTQENKKARLEKEIKEIDRQLKANAADRSNAMHELTLVRKKISNRKDLISECEEEIAGLEKDITLKQHKIDSYAA